MSGGTGTALSHAARQDTDAILSYYHSDDAGRQELSSPRSLTSSLSLTSTSPALDRSDSTNATRTTTSRPHRVGPLQPRVALPSVGSSPSGALLRTSVPSRGGIDRRRLAIVEMDGPRSSGRDRPEETAQAGIRPSDPSGGGSPNNSSSCLEATLVAPPDVSLQSYSASTQPNTVPVPKLQPSITVSRPHSAKRARSSQDAFEPTPKGIGHVARKSSREVAIVGTASFPGSASVPQQSSNNSPATNSLWPPLFQIPQSRSPSPGTSDIADPSCSTGRGRQRKDALPTGVSPVKEVKGFFTPVRTQDIDESKHISIRLASPVVTNPLPQSPPFSPVSSSPYSSSQDFMSPKTNLSTPPTPSTALTSPTAAPSPYLHYQPGLHATAGPLPQPPQAVFNIDPKAPPPPRPPRHSPVRRLNELEAMKQALQLPSHVTAVLSAKTSSPTEKSAVSTTPQEMTSTTSPTVALPTASPPRYTASPCSVTAKRDSGSSPESFGSDGSDPKPHHVREGAFPPSRLCTLGSEAPFSPSGDIDTSLPRLESMDDLVASIGLAIDDMGIINSTDVPPPTVVEPPRGHEGRDGRKGLEIRRSDNIKPIHGRSLSPEGPRTDSFPSSPHSDENATRKCVDPSSEALPPVPAKNDFPYLDTKSLKNALNLKRFSSLPRTPSLMSLNRPSSGSKRSSGTPSPSVPHPGLQPRLPGRTVRSTHPPAMYFADVVVKRTSLERSIGYAHKINEFYHYDCGLADWIVETRYKALHPHSSAKRATVNSSRGPRAPSTSSPSIAPRHISQSSTDSGVTFPRRADAYSATDLAPRVGEDASPPNAPPPLPYPALAAAPRKGPSRASTMIATSSTSSTRSAVSPSSVARSPGSFLASLGRRASIKKDKSLSPSSPPKVLSKSPPRNGNEQPSPRLTNIPLIAPSVPGGPRAPPNRMQRSQTIVITSQNSTNGPNPQRSSTMARRPSLFGGRGSGQQNDDLTSSAEFNRQVDKLAALLPKADKNVLAIYLRRAGQDILAIGQYLEDEKNGTLQYE